MTWSYSGDPGASDLDAVRFLIGDTDTTQQQLTNEEIAYLLTAGGTVRAAALAACRSLSAKYSRLVDQSTGDISISYSQLAANYKTLANDIRSGAQVAPYAGGISKSDMESAAGDSDMVGGFSVGMHDSQ